MIQGLTDEDYGSRGFSVRDPEGNIWSLPAPTWANEPVLLRKLRPAHRISRDPISGTNFCAREAHKSMCAASETTSPLPVTFCGLYSQWGFPRIHRLSTVVTMSSAVRVAPRVTTTASPPLWQVEERPAGLSATVTRA